jgi:hypothetical protein
MDEKEKKKAQQGPTWWYEPRGSKVREYFLSTFYMDLDPHHLSTGVILNQKIWIWTGLYLCEHFQICKQFFW